MSFASALVIIVILLLFDAVFFGFLLKRKRRVVFTLLIEEGAIKSHEGDIPSEFLFDVEQLSRMHKPGNIRITGRKCHERVYLEFSGPLPDELKEKYRDALNLALK